MIRRLSFALLVFALLAAGLYAALAAFSWQPQPQQSLAVSCSAQAPTLARGQPLKVMTWNIQFLAGKRYVFWYDRPDGSGPDQRPSAEDLAYNLDEVARVIRAEAPDVVMLQELDLGAKATDHQDQLALLRERLADLYPCSTQAFERQARFVPDPHVLGAVGRTLATLSRYQIDQAWRVQLPLAPVSWLQRPFRTYPALLVSYLPLQGGGQVAMLNARLDRYSAAAPTQFEQLQVLAQRVDKLEGLGTSWVLGGDLNALPLGEQRRLPTAEQARYSPDSDLHLLWDKYPMIPDNTEASGAEREAWLTFSPNQPDSNRPDRTLDYLVHSPRMLRLEAQVRQADTAEISDHLPVMGTLQLPLK